MTRATNEEKEQMIALVERGIPVSEVAKRTNRSIGTVRKAMRAAGVITPKRAQALRIYRFCDSPLSARYIAKMIGVEASRVWSCRRYFRKHRKELHVL